MYYIILLIVVIIIVILYLLYDHFTETDNVNNEINNIVSMINDNKVEFKNLTVNNDFTGNKFMIKLMNLFYPVNAIFNSKKYYDLNDKQKLKNTPLYYGNWSLYERVDGYYQYINNPLDSDN